MKGRIYSYRDCGYTVISRFEETFRELVANKVSSNFSDFLDGFPKGVIDKALSRYNGEIELEEILENIDFPDLAEIVNYKNNDKFFLYGDMKKGEFNNIMYNLYALRCDIAHVKGQFNSLKFHNLVEYCSKISSELFETQSDFKSFLNEVVENPENIVVKIPSSFFTNDSFNYAVINNLPVPDYVTDGGFVGRIDDKKKVLKYLGSEKFPVVTISGAGGVGKSALALKVCIEIVESSKYDFDYVVWLTAKENRLSHFGIEDIEPSIRSFEDFLDEIIDVCGFQEYLESDNIEDKEEVLNFVLSETKKTLIIVDNLETISDERIINFIIDAPINVKFLITSRKGLGQIERRCEIFQLKERDASVLFRRIANEKGLSSLAKLSDKIIKKYVNRVSCYPLVIKWVIGQAAMGKDINKIVSKINSESSDISRFCFEQIFSELSENCKLVLFSLSCFEEPPTQSVLQHASGLDDVTFEDSLQELILVSLVTPEQFQNENDEISQKFNLLSLTKGFIKNLLRRNNEIRYEIENRIREVYQSVTKSQIASREYKNSLYNYGAKTDDEKVSAMIAQGAFQKYQFGKVDEAREEYKRALKTAPQFASIFRNWAVMEYHENNLETALKLIKEAEQKSDNDPQVLLQWGNILRKSRDFKQADEKYLAAVELSPNDPIILNVCGSNKSRLKEFEAANDLLNQALKVNNPVNPVRHESVNRIAIAENLVFWSADLLENLKFDEAIKNLEGALKQCEKLFSVDSRNPEHYTLLTKVNYRLGHTYHKSGDNLRAKLYFEKLINVTPSGYAQKLYKAKGLTELSMVYYQNGEFDKSINIINGLNSEFSSQFESDPKYLQLKSRIDEILESANPDNRVDGEVSFVNIEKDFFIITSIIEGAKKTFIAGPKDIVNIDMIFNESLKGQKVSFTPNIYKSFDGEEKLSAKMVKLN